MLSSLSDSIDRATTGGVSFREIFLDSPAPSFTHDYSAVVEWVNWLRARGVTDLRAHLAENRQRLVDAVCRIVVTAINPAAVAVIGLPAESLLGPLGPEIITPGSDEAWLTQLETVWHQRRRARVEFLAMNSQSGQAFEARLTMVVPEANGRPDYSRAILTLYDISEQRDRERHLEQLIDAKNRFVSVVSHEIRTPMSAVVAYAQVLQDTHAAMTEDERGDIIDVLSSEALETSHLVEDLLIATRADVGALTVVTESVDLQTELHAVVRGIRLEGEIVLPDESADVRRCRGDAGRVRQIIRNLLTNARRYGGGDVRVSIDEAARHLCLGVHDDGAGVDEDDVGAIFEDFGRSSGGARVSESVGLGLPVSRRLAEAMGGSLVYRRIDGWTTFELQLPLDAGPGGPGDQLASGV